MEKVKKRKPLKLVNDFFLWCEGRNLLDRTPAFLYDYHKKYPHFTLLEENYKTIRKECESLLQYKDEIIDLQDLTEQTKGGIHAIKWKSFMFKSGQFIEENCSLCPETANLLKKIPRIKQAFFSILDPNQHIKPHTGYYQGFLRYHLGVIIPENNVNRKCWIRINDNLEDNQNRDLDSMHRGDTYYWENGKGIMFNDNYLHEAANETDRIRVVLFLDVVRKLPFWLDWLNRILLGVVYKTKVAKQVANNAIIRIKEA